MQQALSLANHALPEDVPVGALVVQYNPDEDGYQIIGEGWNTREQAHSPLGHAELMALTQAAQVLGRWRLTDCILVVTLEPCPMCAGAIAQARLPLIVYGADDPAVGGCGSRWLIPDPKHTQVLGGVLGESCQQALHNFFKARRA